MPREKCFALFGRAGKNTSTAVLGLAKPAVCLKRLPFRLWHLAKNGAFALCAAQKLNLLVKIRSLDQTSIAQHHRTARLAIKAIHIVKFMPAALAGKNFRHPSRANTQALLLELLQV